MRGSRSKQQYAGGSAGLELGTRGVSKGNCRHEGKVRSCIAETRECLVLKKKAATRGGHQTMTVGQRG